jgi:hypothetical protein
MKSTRGAAVLVALACLVAAAPLGAHHGWTICRPDKQIAVTGKVVSLVWQNPHSALRVEVKDHKGAVALWSFELGALPLLTRGGWSKDSVKAGDEVTIKGFPFGEENSNRGSASEVIVGGRKLLSNTHTP